ncbi:MAG TPA: hypothetical protein VG164_12365 [Trebonia sp.]|nr:hypothetical protein [Trebonia sp.]
MDTADRHAWDYLVDQWGEAYEFEHKPGNAHAYTCRRRDNALLLEAQSVESLQNLVRRDYDQAPVPRSVTS